MFLKEGDRGLGETSIPETFLWTKSITESSLSSNKKNPTCTSYRNKYLDFLAECLCCGMQVSQLVLMT